MFFPVSACNRPILRTQIKSLRASLSENYFSIKDFAKLKHLSRARVPQVGSNSGDMPSHWPLSFNAPPSVSLSDPLECSMHCSAFHGPWHFRAESGYAH